MGFWYDNPESMSLSAWNIWHRETKKNYPVQYFFRETLPKEVRVFRMRFTRVKWWFLHRFHPRHKYHVVKPRSVKPGYIDPGDMMFHACFDLLSEYVENRLMKYHITEQDVAEGSDYEKPLLEQQRAVEQKIIELYNWWNDRLVRDSAFDDVPDLSDEQRLKLDTQREAGEEITDPALKEYCDATKNYFEEEQRRMKEDVEKFKELVDIHQSIWY